MELFHGTTSEGADSLASNGIIPVRLQSRDRGFYGDGFYVTTERQIADRHATTVADKRDTSPAVVRVKLPEDASVLDASETLEDDSQHPVTGDELPEWHSEFVEWHAGKVAEAAVWEDIPGVEREDVMDGVREKVTPGTDEFDRLDWYEEVTEYARETGYDAVFWADSEVIVLAYDRVTFRPLQTC